MVISLLGMLVCSGARAIPIPQTEAACFFNFAPAADTDVFDAHRALGDSSANNVSDTSGTVSGSCVADTTYGTLRAGASVNIMNVTMPTARQTESTTFFEDKLTLTRTGGTLFAPAGFLQFQVFLDGTTTGHSGQNNAFATLTLELDDGNMAPIQGGFCGLTETGSGACTAIVPLVFGLNDFFMPNQP